MEFLKGKSSTDLHEPLVIVQPDSTQNSMNQGDHMEGDSENFVGCLPVNSLKFQKKKKGALCAKELAGLPCNSNHSQSGLKSAIAHPKSLSGTPPSDNSIAISTSVVGDIETGSPATENSGAHVHIDLENANPILFEKIKILQEVLKALGSQPVAGCGHGHDHSEEEQESTNETDQQKQSRELKNLRKKRWIQWGQFGEASAGANAVYVIPPILDDILKLCYSNIASVNFTLNPEFTRLNLSLLTLLVSAYPIWRMMDSASRLHALQETYNTIREELMEAIQIAISAAEHTGEDKTDEIITLNDGTSIKLSELTLIAPENAPELSATQKTDLRWDVGAHMIEYTGLTIYALNLISLVNTDVSVRLPLSLAILSASYFACISEQETCRNTLKRMNALKKGQIINDPKANNDANIWTTIAASTKFPALAAASVLDLNKIFLGNIPSAIGLGITIAIGDTTCQWIINKNTESSGEVQSQNSHNNDDTQESQERQLTKASYTFIGARAVGTANERAAAIVIFISQVARLSPTNQSIAAGVGFLLYLSTTYSLEMFNDIPNLLRNNQPLLCGLINTIKQSSKKDTPIQSPLHDSKDQPLNKPSDPPSSGPYNLNQFV